MTEGYVLHSYGPADPYLRHAVASVTTLRRYDTERPVALFCPPAHRATLERHDLASLFERIEPLPEAHRSIVGFKHALHRFAPFARTLFTDTDLVWCRNPDPLWRQLSGYDFTATGNETADAFFGAPKGPAVAADVLLARRRRTLRRFGLTHLPRVQAGMIYVRDHDLAEAVCRRAAGYLARADETHFQSRLRERERTQESCEWSLAMAMSRLGLAVHPWRHGHETPQVDFVEGLVEYDADFRDVTCRYYCDTFVHELRGLPAAWLRDALIAACSQLPGRGDYMDIVPYALHFSWAHHKHPFLNFANRLWQRRAHAGRPVRGEEGA
jgi:hypothetical protein